MSLDNQITAYTQHLKQKGLYRSRAVLEPQSTEMLHFDGNDYLSLRNDHAIRKAYIKGFRLYPSGSGGSMLLSGYHPNHLALERTFAEYLSVDECILVSSGYVANLAITALLGQIKAECIIDKGVHASVYDGLAQAKLNYTRYLHNDLADFSQKIKEDSIVITEGVFSMSGEIAPLDLLSMQCKTYKSQLIVDEAHSIGVLGAEGKGAVDVYALNQDDVPLRIIPLGKAFAAQGALIAGKSNWIHALLQAGRSFIYSTAISPALSYGLLKTLEIVSQADDRRFKLLYLIEYFKEHIKNSLHHWSVSNSPIQQLKLGCPHLAMYYAEELRKEGIYCSAVRPPTVSKRFSGLRVVINFSHTPEDINLLFKRLDCLYERTH